MSTTSTSLIKLGSTARPSRRPLLIGLAMAIVFVAIGLIVPIFIPSNYWMSVLVDVGVMSIVAISIGFLYRQLGLISLGQTAFFGTSSYVVAMLNIHLGWPLVSAALGGIAAGTVMATIVGVLVMRAKGVSFLMLTMVLSLALYSIVLMVPLRPLTGGYDGLILKINPKDTLFGLAPAQIMNDRSFWPVVWSILIVLTLVLWLIGRSRFGQVLHGIRENEERMRFSGFGTLAPRFGAFVIAGAVASVAGVLSTLNSGLVTDQQLGFQVGSQQLVATIVGGLATVAGPIVGAFIFTALQSIFSGVGNIQFFLGMTLVAVLAFLPGGVVGGIQLGLRKLRRSRRGSRKEADNGTV